MVKGAISEMGPLTFIAVRFLIAGLVLLAWYLAAKARQKARERAASTIAAAPGSREAAHGGSTEEPPSREFLIGALITGLVLFFSYATQTLGLVTVAAGKAAFITGTYIVIVPVASRIFMRTSPDRASIIGVALATVGLGLMSLRLPLEIAPGDFLVFLCAVGFSAHILLLEHYSGRGPTVLLAAIQLLVVAVGASVYAAIAERPVRVPAGAWGAILFTAIAATSFAFLAQTAVQRYTSATHTVLIFATEPVFGALFAWLMAGEVLSSREIAGGICILGGMLVSELPTLLRQNGRDRQTKSAT